MFCSLRRLLPLQSLTMLSFLLPRCCYFLSLFVSCVSLLRRYSLLYLPLLLLVRVSRPASQPPAGHPRSPSQFPRRNTRQISSHYASASTKQRPRPPRDALTPPPLPPPPPPATIITGRQQSEQQWQQQQEQQPAVISPRSVLASSAAALPAPEPLRWGSCSLPALPYF